MVEVVVVEMLVVVVIVVKMVVVEMVVVVEVETAAYHSHFLRVLCSHLFNQHGCVGQ